MDKQKTKIVKYRDSDGKLKQSILPIDAPDEDAPLGIVAGLLFPATYEPVRDQLESALIARGIVIPDDLFKLGADDKIRQAIQQVIRMDVQAIKSLNIANRSKR